MTSGEIRIEAISRLYLEPGEVLVIRSSVPLSERQMVALKEAIAAVGLPCKVLVLDRGLSLEVVNQSGFGSLLALQSDGIETRGRNEAGSCAAAASIPE